MTMTTTTTTMMMMMIIIYYYYYYYYYYCTNDIFRQFDSTVVRYRIQVNKWKNILYKRSTLSQST